MRVLTPAPPILVSIVIGLVVVVVLVIVVFTVEYWLTTAAERAGVPLRRTVRRVLDRCIAN